MGKKYTCIKLVTQTIENIRKKKVLHFIKKKEKKNVQKNLKNIKRSHYNFFLMILINFVAKKKFNQFSNKI